MTFKSNYFILEERSLCIPASLLWEIETGIWGLFHKEIFCFPKELLLLTQQSFTV